MRSYRIVLEYSTSLGTDSTGRPDLWDWHSLIAQDAQETVTVVDFRDIPLPDDHAEYFKEINENV
jgi:hypothetical protein